MLARIHVTGSGPTYLAQFTVRSNLSKQRTSDVQSYSWTSRVGRMNSGKHSKCIIHEVVCTVSCVHSQSLSLSKLADFGNDNRYISSIVTSLSCRATSAGQCDCCWPILATCDSYLQHVLKRYSLPSFVL